MLLGNTKLRRVVVRTRTAARKLGLIANYLALGLVFALRTVVVPVTNPRFLQRIAKLKE